MRLRRSASGLYQITHQSKRPWRPSVLPFLPPRAGGNHGSRRTAMGDGAEIAKGAGEGRVIPGR